MKELEFVCQEPDLTTLGSDPVNQGLGLRPNRRLEVPQVSHKSPDRYLFSQYLPEFTALGIPVVTLLDLPA